MLPYIPTYLMVKRRVIVQSEERARTKQKARELKKEQKLRKNKYEN